MLVDNNIMLLEVFTDYLSGLGYEVTSVSESSHFTDILMAGGFDILICDLAMPNFNFDREIRILSIMHKVPQVIVMTGDINKTASKENQFPVLQKPFLFNEFKKLINNHLTEKSS